MKDEYNRPQRQSRRLPYWNYGNNGSYFITICTYERRHFFGEILDGEMRLNPVGDIAKIFWLEISNHFYNIELGEYAIMPNHIHGIININNPLSFEQDKSERDFKQIGKKTLSSIIGSYKSIVSRTSRKNNFDFYWQPRFYDHVIRNEEDYLRISDYIINNPFNWADDEKTSIQTDNPLIRRDNTHCRVR